MSARDTRRVAVDGELTIVTAVDQNQRLLSAVADGGGTLAVDLSGVTDLDTAGLQVLLLAKREADRHGLAIEFRDASRAVQDVLTVARLNEALENPPAGGGPTAGGGARHGSETEA